MGSPNSRLPGFSLSLGVSVLYLSLLVLLPLSTIFLQLWGKPFSDLLAQIVHPRTLAAFRLTLWTSFVAATANMVLGLLIAWVLVRYRFPGRRILDALIDLPFALPTAVAGIALTTIYSAQGTLGSFLERYGIQAAYSPLGIIMALIFVGLPFVVRSVQPVLEDLDPEIEEASGTLGASGFQTFRLVILPLLLPSLLTGFSLSFARALGEYGSVVFISGNMPYRTEIVPLLIMTKLEQFDYAGAAVLGFVMLLASFLLLLAINLLQQWGSQGRLRT